jgi:hypothetical protein
LDARWPGEDFHCSCHSGLGGFKRRRRRGRRRRRRGGGVEGGG